MMRIETASGRRPLGGGDLARLRDGLKSSLAARPVTQRGSAGELGLRIAAEAAQGVLEGAGTVDELVELHRSGRIDLFEWRERARAERAARRSAQRWHVYEGGRLVRTVEPTPTGTAVADGGGGVRAERLARIARVTGRGV